MNCIQINNIDLIIIKHFMMLLRNSIRFLMSGHKLHKLPYYERKQLSKLRTIIINAQTMTEIDEIFLKTSQNQELYSHLFSIACRGYSRVIRNLKEQQFFDIRPLLGRQLENLDKLDLTQLDSKQLCDICNFFSVAHHRMFIDVQNPHLIEFLSKLLVAIFHDQQNIDNFRKISHRLKALRCAQQYQLPYYTVLLDQIEEKFNDFLLFDYLAMLNSILRGKPDGKVFEMEKKLLLSAIRKIVDKKWIEISSPHSFNDLIFPIAQFQQLIPYVFDGQQEQQLWKITQNFQYSNYQKLSSEELIRFIKAVEKVRPNSQFSKDLARTIFSRINPLTGQSSLDPFFITRFVAHHRRFKMYERIDPKWQQKLVSLIEYYFFKQNISTRSAIEGIFTIINSEGLKPENRLKIFDSIHKKLNFEEMENSKKEVMRFFSGLYKFSIKSFQLNEGTELLSNIDDFLLGKKQGNFFYFHLMKELNIIFMRKMGSFIESNRRQIINKNGLKSMEVNDFDEDTIYVYLRNLAEDVSVAGTVKNVNRFNIVHLQTCMEMLRYNMMYKQFFRVIEAVRPGILILDVIFNRITDLPIPCEVHEQLNRLMLMSLRNVKTIAMVYFNMLRQSKNKKKRQSSLQAYYFFTFVHKQTPATQALFLADKQVLCFLLCFQPQNTLKILFSFLENSQIPFSSIQHVIVHCLFYFERYTDNLSSTFQLQNRIQSIPQLSQSAKSNIAKIMHKYNSENNDIFSQIGEICKQQKFQFNAQNKQKISKICGMIQQNSEQSSNNLQILIRMLLYLYGQGWNQNRQSNLYLGTLLAQKLLDLCNAETKQIGLIIKSFMVCYQYRWNIPQIYEHCIRVIGNDDWKNFIPIEHVFTRICLYPHDHSLRIQQLPDIIELFTYHPSELFPYLHYFMNRHHKLLEQTYFSNYLTYLHNVPILANNKIQKINVPEKQEFIGKQKLNCK